MSINRQHPTLNYLVFDDDNEAANQYKLKISIAPKLCNLIFINPTDFYDVEANKFNNKEFISKIQEATQGKHINLIISDWNILDANPDGFSGIVGWDVIEATIMAKEKLKNTPFLIYSADIGKASNFVISRIEKDIKSNDITISQNFLNAILELQLTFCRRDEHRFNKITELLRRSDAITNIVLDSMLKFDQNMIVNTGNKNFDGKQIAELTKEPINHDGLQFIREFIELSIANYTELNA